MVLEIDEERRRISLGLKQCKPNPWEEFAKTTIKASKLLVRSSQSLTLVSSSVLTAVLMVWFTCQILAGTLLAKKPFVITKR